MYIMLLGIITICNLKKYFENLAAIRVMLCRFVCQQLTHEILNFQESKMKKHVSSKTILYSNTMFYCYQVLTICFADCVILAYFL